jgi:uroporphyrinogen-III synthase
MSGLTGHTVLLTRADEDNAAWAAVLTGAGARVISLPCIRAEAIESAAPALRQQLVRADWLVFTSRRGVEACAGLAADALPTTTRIAVVGAATAAEAERQLGRTNLIAQPETAAGLATALAAEVGPGSCVVLALAENAADTLADALAATGAECIRIDLYRTVPAPPAARKRALSSLGADNVLLASPSTVTGFVNQVAMDIDVDIYTIGPTTTQAARAAGLNVTAQAEHPSLEGLMEAMTCAS